VDPDFGDGVSERAQDRGSAFPVSPGELAGIWNKRQDVSDALVEAYESEAGSGPVNELYEELNEIEGYIALLLLANS